MPGQTAMYGLLDIGRLKPNENVFISAAAGAVGSMVAQICKKVYNCRVIGCVSSNATKQEWLLNEINCDGIIDYTTFNNDSKAFEIELKKQFPNGIDLYFDNVGGPILDNVLPNMALYGRIAISGLISDYEKDRPTAPQRFDQILMKRLTVTGFFSPDFMDQGPRLTKELLSMLKNKSIEMPFDQTNGLENMLKAYSKLFTGENIGKVLLQL